MDFLKDHPPECLKIPETEWDKMFNDIANRAPQEACGLVIGSGELASEVIPITNILHSPVKFRMDPKEQLEVFEKLEAQKLALLGIYHSHPKGPAGPSSIDLAEAYYPNSVQLIWSPATEGWSCMGFVYLASEVKPVRLEIISG